MKVTAAFAAGVVALGALAFALASRSRGGAGVTRGAEAGVLVSVVAGLITLVVEGQAVKRSLQLALGLSVALFFVRFGVWGLGMRWAKEAAADRFAFSAAFFALYAVLVWVEIGFVLTASRRGRGAVA